MKEIVLLSGGLDSAVCLALELQNAPPREVLALNAFYGQRHERERQSARKIADFYGAEWMELDLSAIFAGSGCSLLARSGKSVPRQSYAAQIAESGGNPVETYVPFRNGLMISAAASVAYSVGASAVCYGAHSDDAAGSAYPDCSVPFAEAMDRAVSEGTGGKISVRAPLLNMSKAQVVKSGLSLGVPFELTWSCYEGGEKPCGKCATCLDRARAFEANGMKDPAQ